MREEAIKEATRGQRNTATTDQFKCSKCHQRKCTYYQMQTRSADEPMTTFVTCTARPPPACWVPSYLIVSHRIVSYCITHGPIKHHIAQHYHVLPSYRLSRIVNGLYGFESYQILRFIWYRIISYPAVHMVSNHIISCAQRGFWRPSAMQNCNKRWRFC